MSIQRLSFVVPNLNPHIAFEHRYCTRIETTCLTCTLWKYRLTSMVPTNWNRYWYDHQSTMKTQMKGIWGIRKDSRRIRVFSGVVYSSSGVVNSRHNDSYAK